MRMMECFQKHFNKVKRFNKVLESEERESTIFEKITVENIP